MLMRDRIVNTCMYDLFVEMSKKLQNNEHDGCIIKLISPIKNIKTKCDNSECEHDQKDCEKCLQEFLNMKVG